MKTTKALDRIRAQAARVVDPTTSEAERSRAARTVSDEARDLADVFALVRATSYVGRVVDMFAIARGDADATQRAQLRGAASELRDLADLTGLTPREVVLGTSATGVGPVALIRQVAEQFGIHGVAPVVPQIVADVDLASVDPTLPLTGEQVTITDAGSARARHQAAMLLEGDRQVMDWLSDGGRQLLDRIVLDAVDLAAEAYVAGELVTAAGGTRAAGADLGAALDESEGAAGTRGLVPWLLVNPTDLPAVRRALAPGYFDGPHPELLASVGQPAGTATHLGADAMYLFADDYISQSQDAPRTLGKNLAVVRPFYFAVRDEDAIQTVTGIGA